MDPEPKKKQQMDRIKTWLLAFIIFHIISAICKINVIKGQGKWFHQTLDEVHSFKCS